MSQMGFKPLNKLGKGTFGTVWRAEVATPRPSKTRLVGLKVSSDPYDSDRSRHVVKSLELIRNLVHSCLPRVYTYGEAGGWLFVAMELAEEDLRSRVERCSAHGGALTVAELRTRILDIARALDYLHERGLVHGCVKPDDMLIIQDRTVLGDFDLVQSINEADAAWIERNASPAYLAPEVYRGCSTVQSDQFSLAYSYVQLKSIPCGTSIDRRESNGPFSGLELGTLTTVEQNAVVKAMSADPQHASTPAPLSYTLLDEKRKGKRGQARLISRHFRPAHLRCRDHARQRRRWLGAAHRVRLRCTRQRVARHKLRCGQRRRYCQPGAGRVQQRRPADGRVPERQRGHWHRHDPGDTVRL